MKIKYHSYYDFFPNYKPDEGKPCIHCYNDNFVFEDVEPNSIALLIEPRSIQPKVYEYMESEGYKKFIYIFTHDSKLLELPNAKFATNIKVWGWSDVPKTKFCSMISSDKEMCELHIERKQLAMRLKDKIDCFGTFDGGERVDTITAHKDYMYAVVMENYIDDYWFTEKILNCFANKVIPIYYGARKIDEFFNKYGIIHVNCVKGIEEYIDLVQKSGFWKYYYNRPYVQEAIEDNYNRVKEYENFETWFMTVYGELLNELYKIINSDSGV